MSCDAETSHRDSSDVSSRQAPDVRVSAPLDPAAAGGLVRVAALVALALFAQAAAVLAAQARWAASSAPAFLTRPVQDVRRGRFDPPPVPASGSPLGLLKTGILPRQDRQAAAAPFAHVSA